MRQVCPMALSAGRRPSPSRKTTHMHKKVAYQLGSAPLLAAQALRPETEPGKLWHGREPLTWKERTRPLALPPRTTEILQIHVGLDKLDKCVHSLISGISTITISGAAHTIVILFLRKVIVMFNQEPVVSALIALHPLAAAPVILTILGILGYAAY